jgi:predicted transcriptional regulator
MALYACVMSKSITIRVPDEVYEELQARARAEGTTVTTLLTEAAVRDPRLNQGAEVAAAFLAKHADEFRAAFGEDGPTGEPGTAPARKAA